MLLRFPYENLISAFFQSSFVSPFCFYFFSFIVLSVVFVFFLSGLFDSFHFRSIQQRGNCHSTKSYRDSPMEIQLKHCLEQVPIIVFPFPLCFPVLFLFSLYVSSLLVSPFVIFDFCSMKEKLRQPTKHYWIFPMEV